MFERKIPIIYLAHSSIPTYDIFNINNWSDQSKGIVQSCSTEFSILSYEVARIKDLCSDPIKLCYPIYRDLMENQWKIQSWDLSNTVCLAQIPEMHVYIEAFLSGAKSLLDLIVQLISSENIVGSKLHGFHKASGTYGGNVLNCLNKNVRKGQDKTAQVIRDLVVSHKDLWIDELIKARHELIHPLRGTEQLMFHIELEDRDGNLLLKGANPPYIFGSRIDDYSTTIMEHIRQFSISLLDTIKNAY